MTRAPSLDLRRRVTDALAQGKSRRAAAEQFAISTATAVRLQKRLEETGSVEPARMGRPKGSGKLGPYRDVIIARVEAQPDITMPDLAAWLEANHGVMADPSNLSKLLCRAGFSYKKTLLAAERERADVKAERDQWHTHRLPAIQAAPARLVFIDETSVKTNMTPLRGRSRKGERLIAEAPFGKWNTQTFIAALRCDALAAPWVIEGAMDGEAFETYVATQLAPILKPGDVVVWDNLNLHKSPRAADAIKARGAWALFLPRYSPDLNPIEKAFSKLKALLRKAKARTYDDRWKAVGNGCNLFTPHECANDFKTTGCVAN